MLMCTCISKSPLGELYSSTASSVKTEAVRSFNPLFFAPLTLTFPFKEAFPIRISLLSIFFIIPFIPLHKPLNPNRNSRIGLIPKILLQRLQICPSPLHISRLHGAHFLYRRFFCCFFYRLNKIQ